MVSVGATVGSVATVGSATSVGSVGSTVGTTVTVGSATSVGSMVSALMLNVDFRFDVESRFSIEGVGNVCKGTELTD